ncbi:MAG: hypothetical protein A2X07_06285 [Flavobacteria bacterium GWF1_32_7]|nr:MAG: hypothetical protein A2X07_06285 [Flavobacteria bacterium GWF1_32_7]
MGLNKYNLIQFFMLEKITFNHCSINKISFLMKAFMLLGFVQMNYAQMANNGALYIADNATFFLASGNLTFGPAPATTATTKSGLNHGVLTLGEMVTTTGASNSHFVNGYVRAMGTTAQVLPIGDAGTIARVRVVPSANFGVEAAAFKTNPSTIGTALSGVVTDISDVEYWDINGTPTTVISLSWSAGSGVSALTEADLNKLLIVGWNGSAWVEIPATVDVNAFFGGASSFTSGSITTGGGVDLTAFSEFTLGAKNTLSSNDFANSNLFATINNDALQIEAATEMKNVTVYDLTGRVVARYGVNGETTLNKDFSHASGVYLVQIELESGAVLTKKLINQ